MPLSDEPRFDPGGINKPLIGVAIAVALALGGWFYWHRAAPPPAAPPVLTPAPRNAAPAAEDTIEHPLPPGDEATQTPLPELNNSDGALVGALRNAAGSDVLQFLVPESLIRRIVVTIDNLPRQKVAADKRPVAPPGGNFVANGDELRSTLDDRNFERYAPLVRTLAAVDMKRLGAVYVRFYPLFQKAYQDLGYPNGYFNDRLIQVIDVLLATPQAVGPIELERPNVMYVYADPALESRAAGQKLLIRMGPDNATAVKLKLAELRAFLTATPPRR